MMQTVYVGVCWVETQTAQQKRKGGMSRAANTHMANGAGTALHPRTVSQNRKKRISATADQAKAYERFGATEHPSEALTLYGSGM